MRCVCVYCGILYNVKEPFDEDFETHGNCDECDRMEKHNLAIAMREWSRHAQDKNSRPQA